MKFNLKSLAAAVALAGASMSAMAGIQAGTGVGGSELVFYAFDETTGTSYVKDLGVTFSGFSGTYSSAGSLNISSDTNWTSYLGSVGNDTSGTTWGVMANLITGSGAGAGGTRLLTTTRNNVVTIPNTLTSNTFSAVNASFNSTFLGALADASSAGVNNSYFSPAGNTNSDNWSQFMKHNAAGKTNPLNLDNFINGSVNATFIDISRAATNVKPTSVTQSYYWNFDGNTLYAAPVPEPETYGLMLAGLALVGAIARRRRA